MPVRASWLRTYAVRPLALIIMASTAASPSVAANYSLSAGDAITFAIAGAPEMQTKVTIGSEGSISLPFIGEVSAAGRSINELRAEVRNLMSQKEYRQHLPGSPRGASEVIWPDQVMVNVSDYRPVYLNGDVAKPGEQKFTPGMTIRQALSLAGGYDILRFRMDNPFLQAADMRAAYENAWIDYAREQARLARLNTELGTEGPKADVGLSALPLSPALLKQIKGVEAEYLKTRDENVRKQRTHLRALLTQQDVAIDVFTKRRDTEVSGKQFDEDEYRRLDSLYRAGTLPMARVAEGRRIMLLSATQALQSEVELQRVKTEREVTRRQMESFEESRRLEILAMQQESQTKMAALQSSIQSIADKLLYAGALKTQLTRGTGGRPDLMLFRNGRPGVTADEEAELQPGDVVEVALKVEGAGERLSSTN